MSETMKAAIFVEPGKMAVEEVPKAALQQDDDIVIRHGAHLCMRL